VYADEPTWRILSLPVRILLRHPAGQQLPPYLTRHRHRRGRAGDDLGRGGAVSALPFQLPHGDIAALGFRFGAMAYTPDLVGCA